MADARSRSIAYLRLRTGPITSRGPPTLALLPLPLPFLLLELFLLLCNNSHLFLHVASEMLKETFVLGCQVGLGTGGMI